MTITRKSVLIGAAFVSVYFVGVSVAFRIIVQLGYDARQFEYLQGPLTFPLALPPVEFWN